MYGMYGSSVDNPIRCLNIGNIGSLLNQNAKGSLNINIQAWPWAKTKKATGHCVARRDFGVQPEMTFPAGNCMASLAKRVD